MTTRNPITIEVLETLDAIDRRGSYAKAAEELNKATSAVSYCVQKLEEQLDISLFQRQGRRSVLTPAGRLVLEEGRKIVNTTIRLASTAKELATGWEPRIRVAVESTQSCPVFFKTVQTFLDDHANIEIDLIESVLNGGWEALEQDRVELLVGGLGPVPLQKGYRAVPIERDDLVLVIADCHKLSKQVVGLGSNSGSNDDSDKDLAAPLLSRIRRVITHDTSLNEVARSEGLTSGGQNFYVQNMDQKVESILAGIGIGHLPRKRVQTHLDNGTLLKLNIETSVKEGNFMAWKISNKGKGLRALTQMLMAADWSADS